MNRYYGAGLPGREGWCKGKGKGKGMDGYGVDSIEGGEKNWCLGETETGTCCFFSWIYPMELAGTAGWLAFDGCEPGIINKALLCYALESHRPNMKLYYPMNFHSWHFME